MLVLAALRRAYRRRVLLQTRLYEQLDALGKVARERARVQFRADAMAEVLKKEEEDEKERKKDMQRKRRREKALADQKIKAEVQAKIAAEAAEREKIERAERFEAAKKLAAERAMKLDAEGDLQIDLGHESDRSGLVVIEEEGPKNKKRKTIVQKKGRQLKDPKEIIKEQKEPKDVEMKDAKIEQPKEIIPHISKGFNQMYDQIWKDIAKKEIPKVYRIQQQSLSTKQSNLRKTAQLASKEARRWQQRTNKNVKDTQARAKRCMREMMSFWKRNEREERDSRRRAEKEALERAKKEEEMRETRRQARKLEFLISQTELYSHFIGRKIKTDEIERSTDDVAGAEQPLASSKYGAIDDKRKAGPSTTRFEDLDFDNEDETALREAALNNAQNAIQEAQERARAFNNVGQKTDLSNINLDEGEMNFQNPTSLGDIEIQQPKMLTVQLKDYQLKGLNWLCNLYEQGINGILADEMGLGKTVQSISVMAYLAEVHNIWGPFLVIAPASTLHNWQQEITRFVPQLKALPYWGNAKDRKVLRKFWDRKHVTYTKDSPFHVLITSYQLVVGDAQYFQKMKWQYMILDEAQAIKSSSSSRWKALLAFHCRNRLLLTGTPIQNSMQELWALLHFIMPSLFDSHDEFSEWFSKDIESHAQSNTQLNEAQLRRLHMILKPFMLRRIKKHVQKELGDKIELDIYCNLTYRQRALYKSLRDKISFLDVIEKASSGGEEGTQTLMNLVMQFRKVCNHPDLFERAETRSPLSFASFADTVSFMREGQNVSVYYTSRNRIQYKVPKLVYREDRLDVPGHQTQAGFKRRYLDHLMNIWSSDYIYESTATDRNSPFSWLRFIDSSPQEVASSFHTSEFDKAAAALTHSRNLGRFSAFYDKEKYVPPHTMLLVSKLLDKNPAYDHFLPDWKPRVVSQNGTVGAPPVFAPPIGVDCPDPGVVIEQDSLYFNPHVRRILYGPSNSEEEEFLNHHVKFSKYPLVRTLPDPFLDTYSYAAIQVPLMRRFVSDSGKLAALDKLLMELKAGGHRVLLYFQMTRMMDLAEEYLSYRNYKYLRLDGSSKVEDRRDMVNDFQTRPEIFLFLLSTRAGGLGLNLTAADCVIFYDSDWNPTVDQQAEDRAHRLGQTKQVRVYRLLTRGTIEERIRQRALQKQDVQKVVMSGTGTDIGEKPVNFSKGGGNRDVAAWLFDDEQMAQLAATEKAKEEAKAARGGKRNIKKAITAPSTQMSTDPTNLLENMYHEGEGKFESEAATPANGSIAPAGIRKKPGPKAGSKTGRSNKKKTTKERLQMVGDGIGEDL
ncbi:SNF2 family N-terminal domain-containing protein [Kalaharituber pfeilii]|nr:SNF2 family N-terminal domain-containing protein [Kalaharituber pfeilii]